MNPPSRLFVNLAVDDLERSRVFYVAWFGFRVAFDSDWFVQLTTAPAGEEGGLELGLLPRESELLSTTDRRPPGGVMLSLVVDDVDSLHADMVADGVAIERAPENAFYGQRRMTLRDPDGTWLDVSTPCEPDADWSARLRPLDGGGYTDRTG